MLSQGLNAGMKVIWCNPQGETLEGTLGAVSTHEESFMPLPHHVSHVRVTTPQAIYEVPAEYIIEVK